MSPTPETPPIEPSANDVSALRSLARAVKRTGLDALAYLRRPSLFNLNTPERVGAVFMAENNQPMPERFYLYTLIRGLRPERALEIGVLYGGSSLIITNAMEDNGRGRLVGIDPNPKVRSMKKMHGRFSIVQGYSPDAIPEAVERLGGKLDFAFTDSLVSHKASSADFEALIPHMADGGYILQHNPDHYGLNLAGEEALKREPNLHDCGFISRSAKLEVDPWVALNGFRLFRVASPEWTGMREIENAYAAAGKTAPPFSRDIINHGKWLCKNVEPCERCRAEATGGTSGAAV